jgi:hypothetical protein
MARWTMPLTPPTRACPRPTSGSSAGTDRCRKRFSRRSVTRPATSPSPPDPERHRSPHPPRPAPRERAWRSAPVLWSFCGRCSPFPAWQPWNRAAIDWNRLESPGIARRRRGTHAVVGELTPARRRVRAQSSGPAPPVAGHLARARRERRDRASGPICPGVGNHLTGRQRVRAQSSHATFALVAHPARAGRHLLARASATARASAGYLPRGRRAPRSRPREPSRALVRPRAPGRRWGRA